MLPLQRVLSHWFRALWYLTQLSLYVIEDAHNALPTCRWNASWDCRLDLSQRHFLSLPRIPLPLIPGISQEAIDVDLAWLPLSPFFRFRHYVPVLSVSVCFSVPLSESILLSILCGALRYSRSPVCIFWHLICYWHEIVTCSDWNPPCSHRVLHSIDLSSHDSSLPRTDPLLADQSRWF